MLEEIIKKAVLEILTGQKNETQSTPEKKSTLSDMIGKYVLIRAHRAGVNVGYFSGEDEEFLKLTDSRKLWLWNAAQGVALESFAQFGDNAGKTRATGTVAIYLVRKDDICGIMSIDDPKTVEQIKNLKISHQD